MAEQANTSKRRNAKRSRARASIRLLPAVPAHDARVEHAQATGTGEAISASLVVTAGRQAQASRRALVWTMRIEGLDVDTIAARMDISASTVRADLQVVGKAAAEYARGRADEARELELARLDEMWRAWYAQGTALVDVYAAPILLRIIELRMKLLRLDSLPADDAPADRPLASLSDDDLRARLHAVSADAPGAAGEPAD